MVPKLCIPLLIYKHVYLDYRYLTPKPHSIVCTFSISEVFSSIQMLVDKINCDPNNCWGNGCVFMTYLLQPWSPGTWRVEHSWPWMTDRDGCWWWLSHNGRQTLKQLPHLLWGFPVKSKRNKQLYMYVKRPLCIKYHMLNQNIILVSLSKKSTDMWTHMCINV